METDLFLSIIAVITPPWVIYCTSLCDNLSKAVLCIVLTAAHTAPQGKTTRFTAVICILPSWERR